ncbi:MAG: hypothetical protein Q7J73_10780 [Dehalococcoidales bacterium]|nr:hypothetical protein [Dehalococcoidales bacterium]
MPPSLAERLRKAGIRHYDVKIHDQKKDWLVKNFKAEGAAPAYPVNVSRLMRNLVWQMKERVAAGEKEFHELVRTYWYMYIKSTLARAGALSAETDQYKQLTENIADMVRVFQLMTYKDIGFRDENEANKRIGVNANIIPFSEKLGHFNYLTELHQQYNVSAIALGGQPSVMNIEYFVDDLKKAKSGPQLVDRPKVFSLPAAAGSLKFNLKRSFYLYSIVDFDPSGWIIRDAFINNLRHYKIKNTKVYDLINPDMLTPEEILMARYPIRAGADMEAKNKKWLADVEARHYKNQKYLVEDLPSGKKKLYGLEAEAIATARITEKLKEVMLPVIGGNEEALKIYEMKNLDQAIKDLMIFKLTHPETEKPHGR